MSTVPETPENPPAIAQTLRRAAERAYDNWIENEPGAGAAFAGDADVKEGFIDGYLAACKEWGPF